MSNSPQMLGQRTRGSSLQSSRAVSAPGAQDLNPTAQQQILQQQLQQQHLGNPQVTAAMRQQQQLLLQQQQLARQSMAHQAFLANDQGGGMPINRENERDPSPKKLHKEQQDREIYSNDFLRARSLQGGQGYPPPETYGPLPPHRNRDSLLFRLRSTHYTISKDHTSGQEAHEASLLASFGKGRRTDKPSIPLGGSRLLQPSPNFLPSLANDNDITAQNGGSVLQKISQFHSDSSNNRRPVHSKRLFSCPKCQKSFSRDANMRRHLHTKHKHKHSSNNFPISYPRSL